MSTKKGTIWSMVRLSSAMQLRTLHLELCRTRRLDIWELPSLECLNFFVLTAVTVLEKCMIERWVICMLRREICTFKNCSHAAVSSGPCSCQKMEVRCMMMSWLIWLFSREIVTGNHAHSSSGARTDFNEPSLNCKRKFNYNTADISDGELHADE